MPEPKQRCKTVEAGNVAHAMVVHAMFRQASSQCAASERLRAGTLQQLEALL